MPEEPKGPFAALKAAFVRCYKNRDGSYSPNYAALTIALTIFFTALLCAGSLWIPVSRIANLRIRAVGLAAADAFASFAAATGADRIAPALREGFLDATGLAGNLSWDSRYFNRRQPLAASRRPVPAASGTPGTSAARGESGAAADAPASGDARAQEQGGGVSASGGIAPESALGGTAPESAGIVADGGIDAEGRSASAASVASALPVPPAPASSALFTTHSSANPLRVYVFGDSQVYSLGIGLSRLAGKDSPIDVEYLAVHSSGFIRQDYFSWTQKLADTFAEDSFDAGIVMMGMNDYQNFWDDDGRVVVKGTPEWEAAYKKKCEALLDTALMYLPKLYWLGMPAVRSSEYDGHLAYIEKVQRGIAAGYSPDLLSYVSLRDTIPGAGKPYTETFVNADGKQFKIMGDDGSHFTVVGGQFVMKPLFDALCEDFLFSELPIAQMPE